MCWRNFLTVCGTHSPPSEVVTFVLPWGSVHAFSPGQLVVSSWRRPPLTPDHTSARTLCPWNDGEPPSLALDVTSTGIGVGSVSGAESELRADRGGGGVGGVSAQHWSSAFPPPTENGGLVECLEGPRCWLAGRTAELECVAEGGCQESKMEPENQ